eukprot:SAG25_NODE_1195_length_3647_cov_3.030722_4_plen_374_part_00
MGALVKIVVVSVVLSIALAGDWWFGEHRVFPKQTLFMHYPNESRFELLRGPSTPHLHAGNHDPMHILPRLGATQGEIALFRNAFVANNGVITSAAGVGYVNAGCTFKWWIWTPQNWLKIWGSHAYQPDVHRHHAVVTLIQPYSGIWHLLFESGIALMALESAGGLPPDAVLHIDSSMYHHPMVRAFWAAFQIPVPWKQVVHGPITAEQLHVPRIAPCGTTTPEYVHWLRRRSLVQPGGNTSSNVVLVKRARWRLLHPQSYADTLSILSRVATTYNKTLVIFDEAKHPPYPEQQQIFAHAWLVVGQEGMGLHHLLIAPSHTRVVEIMPTNRIVHCTDRIPYILGMPTVVSPCRPTAQGCSVNRSDMYRAIQTLL